ncbi:LAETG motif-containing sortase-dependent surface protein [Streptomyces sp. NPDC006487]|uniref:LAETG motif-containing sortase-dependent surface protein n=1 Tax=Streptomyces sp. NPDC006487 TaxID=3364748 RepID=UPI0036783A04
MSARSAVFRSAALRSATLRTGSAAVVAAAVAGTFLAPLSASADEGNPKALKTAMSAPVPSGPLTRGGATETFDLTVTNTTDKSSSYHPWMLLDPTGASPLQKADVIYKVEPVSAPATSFSIGQQDNGWQGMFYPAGTNSSQGFEIPAGGKLVWKVTIGLGKSYPTINGDFTLRAASFQNEIADGGMGSLTFKTSPAGKPGALETWFDKAAPCADGASPDCRELDLHYRVTGDGVFGSGLGTWLEVATADLDQQPAADLRTRIKVDGAWKDLKGTSGSLPVIAKGFGAASGDHIVRLQVKLGPKATLKKLTPIKVITDVGLAEGNTYPFQSAEGKFELGPKTTTPPTTPAPTSPAPTSPAPTTPAPASPTTTAPAATTTPATGNTPAPTGSLAHTGSDSNTGLYSGLAVVLIGLGGAAAWFARRRRTVRG